VSRALRWLGCLAGVALVVLAAHHFMVWTSLRGIIFPGTRLPPYSGPLPLDVVRLELRHTEGSTHGLLRLPRSTAGGATPAPLVVYFHGNYELAEQFPWSDEPYAALGCALLVVEYRGYGASEGTPSEAHIVEDALALVDVAAAHTPIDRERVVLHGRSVGGGIAAAVARRSPPCALVLESALSSVMSMGRRQLALPYLVRDRLDVADCLARHYRGPVLIVHSETDEVIPVREAHRNARAAGRGELVLTTGRSHQESWLRHDPATIVAFVTAALQRR
jgi:fermentation-respiration switch protein FrsA (DUF1100 family)